uniref:Ig-like domain-containing protein n=1 Tax=Clastoptera arizonana TaxID=38151 RepID=A0A1B6EFL9_9HEMI
MTSNRAASMRREAVLVCIVEDLAAYKVAWLRVDTQTILTIHNYVITKNKRIGVSYNEHTVWNLHIREVHQSDRGWYMCQLNTDPMKSQVGFLEVVVPPDILDYPTSSDMIVQEGANVTLRCAASGYPAPNITWRREGGDLLPSMDGKEVNVVDGPELYIQHATRRHMGAYLCIASNGIPPSVMKRMMLVVNFPPMVWISKRTATVGFGQHLTLECKSEAYPKAVNYWTKGKGEIIANGKKFDTHIAGIGYNILMKLTIKHFTHLDQGEYKCVSKNVLGEVHDTITVSVLDDNEVLSTGLPRHKELILAENGYNSGFSTVALPFIIVSLLATTQCLYAIAI